MDIYFFIENQMKLATPGPKSEYPLPAEYYARAMLDAIEAAARDGVSPHAIVTAMQAVHNKQKLKSLGLNTDGKALNATPEYRKAR